MTNPYRPPSSEETPRADQRRPLLDPRADPLGALLVLVPPVFAALHLVAPRPLPFVILSVVLGLIAVLDSHRWKLSPAWWVFACFSLWPIAIPAYLHDRAARGAATTWWISIPAVALALALAFLP